MKTTEKKQPLKRTSIGFQFGGNEEEEKPVCYPVDQVQKEIKEDRVTLHVESDLYQKIKIMAHWELTTIKEIINNALRESVNEYEKKHGELVKVRKSEKKKA